VIRSSPSAARQRVVTEKAGRHRLLLKQRLVLPSHSHGLRALIEQGRRRKKLKLDVKLKADSFRVLTSLVEEGLGYTLLPKRSRAAFSSGYFCHAAIV
jgi:LysR family transcriptional regulator, nitrogen assimilation regulatory protein